MSAASVATLLVVTLAVVGYGGRQLDLVDTAHVVASTPLVSDDGGAAMFDGGLLSPGRELEACIELAYEGELRADQLHVGARAVAGDLAPHLLLRIEEGEGGRYGDCDGFQGRELFRGTLADLAATTPVGVPGTWQPSTGDHVSFRVRAEMSATAAAGTSTSGDLVWTVTAPGGEPDPAPEPDPDPAPDPDPEPDPAPDPEPDPDPRPDPKPEPDPSPAPGPESDPDPTPAPDPDPASDPGMEPAPEPDPPPGPGAEPVPASTDEATPRPLPDAEPAPLPPVEAPTPAAVDPEPQSADVPDRPTPPGAEPEAGAPGEAGTPAPTPRESSGRRLPTFRELREGAGALVRGVVERSEYPLALLTVVGAFLLVQNRMDKRDPKLALAPMYPDPDLPFEDPTGQSLTTWTNDTILSTEHGR